jgi:hypothetical protein
MSDGCPVCQGSGVMADDVCGAVPCARCMSAASARRFSNADTFACPECGHPLAMHVLGYGCGVEVEEGAVLLSLCKCEKYQ